MEELKKYNRQRIANYIQYWLMIMLMFVSAFIGYLIGVSESL